MKAALPVQYLKNQHLVEDKSRSKNASYYQGFLDRVTDSPLKKRATLFEKIEEYPGPAAYNHKGEGTFEKLRESIYNNQLKETHNFTDRQQRFDIGRQ